MCFGVSMAIPLDTAIHIDIHIIGALRGPGDIDLGYESSGISFGVVGGSDRQGGDNRRRIVWMQHER
jgi:hypothetical protein